MRKQLLTEYIELRVQQHAEETPYFDLLGCELSIFDTIDKANKFINRLLGLDEYAESLISDFVWWNGSSEIFAIYDEDRLIETPAELADYIIKNC